MVGEGIRRRIVSELKDATDVVISHYHGDHIPLLDANPYQLSLKKVAGLMKKPRLWCKSVRDDSPAMRQRYKNLVHELGRRLVSSEGHSNGPFTFSLAMPHGKADEPNNTVMMTRIEEDGFVFVHASDIQLLNNDAVYQIIDWKPDVVLFSGPPLYLSFVTTEDEKNARQRALAIAKKVDKLIIDHHLMRCEKGVRWLDSLSRSTRNHVVCAADFMGQPRLLLEAWRKRLYVQMPVPDGWHDAYAHGRVNTKPYRSIKMEAVLQ
jgi:hypothetical protein